MNDELYEKLDGILRVYNPPGYGTVISIGDKPNIAWIIRIPGKHFNWFQKKMMKWCFGWNVQDYSDA